VIGQRPGEVAKMRKDLLQLDAKPPIWRKLPEEVKQLGTDTQEDDDRHRVVLTPAAVQIIKDALNEPLPLFNTAPGGQFARANRNVPWNRGAPYQTGPYVHHCEFCGRQFSSRWRTRARFCNEDCSNTAWDRKAKRNPKALAVNTSPYVFPGLQGKGLYLHHTWVKLLKMAGIKNCHIHDLRHTFASYAVSNGIDLFVVSKLLGHKSIQSTQRYAHLLIDAKAKAVEQVAEIIDFDKIRKRV
jgi:integrase